MNMQSGPSSLMTDESSESGSKSGLGVKRQHHPWLTLERSLLVLGLALLGFYAAARIHGAFLSRASIHSFEALRTKSPVPDRPPDPSQVDFSLWSDNRVTAYKQSLAQHFDQPLAVLRVDKIHLEVPLLNGTDDLTLNRGVGRIIGTARPGQIGNIGIAGHRDGFFRGLKDVVIGDRIELLEPNRTDTYVVDKVQIVYPEDVSLLQPTSSPSLTLVTCYPFYFIGSAPQRYIVRASIENPKPGK
jgi:sortase A